MQLRDKQDTIDKAARCTLRNFYLIAVIHNFLHFLYFYVKSSKMNKGKIFKLAKGFRERAKNCIRIARERVEKALQYSYMDWRIKKRDMQSLWI